MTVNPFEMRLDAAVWTPTALGTVGPSGLLRDATVGGGATYRPLLTSHRQDGPLADGLDRVVELIEDADALRAVLAAPAVAHWGHTGSTVDDAAWAEGRKVAVAMHDRGGQGFNGLLVGGLHPGEDRIAHVSTFWVPNTAWLRAADADDVLAAGWLALFRGLAERGAVGVRATELWSGRDFVDVLRRIAGFRPIADHYATVGLSPADDKTILCEWRATVEDGQVVRFGSRPLLDETAHRVLIRLLDRYFSQLPLSTDEAPGTPVPGERLTFRGEIGIDGVRGWGTGPEPGGWFDAPPDNVPDGADLGDLNGRARRAFADWLRRQGDGTA